MSAGPAAPADDPRLSRFKAALAQGDFGEALAAIKQLPDDLRSSFHIRAHEAHLSGTLGRHEEEIAILRDLIAAEPGMPSLHVSLAHALKTLGRRDEAIAATRAALALNRDYGKAWWVLAEFKTYRFSDSEVAAMEAALARPLSEADRLNVHFALGRAREQRGEAEAAFAHFAAGNAIRIASAPSNAAALGTRVDRAIDLFTSAFFADRQGFGHDSDEPIFVLGLHRSGSTLIEQILAGHSQIEATAELPIIGQLMGAVGRDRSLAGGTPLEKLATLDSGRARALGADYLRQARDYRATDKPRFVDKMPANWLHVGFIRLILPNATIVDARRHPLAAGFSNFRQNFDQGANWSYSLESIGRYYRDYLRLMRHFDRVLPGHVHRVIHERLVEDFEPEVRRLLDHVGVDFEPGVLDFHRSKRPVRSASAEQVRQPLSREGLDQWRAFEPWLGPLKAALGHDLETWQE